MLLDTSFILPSLGVDVEPEVIAGLKKLVERKDEIYFSGYSVLESLWVAAKLSNRSSFDGERFKRGLKAVLESGVFKRVEESADTFDEALRLHRLGHNDMIDDILYASSTTNGLRFLTVDSELRGFVRAHGLPDSTIFPDELKGTGKR